LEKLQEMERIKYFWKNNLVDFIVVIIKNYWKNRKCKKFVRKCKKFVKKIK
jgi:predicted negative regulator of RcsB-dependent stress response